MENQALPSEQNEPAVVKYCGPIKWTAEKDGGLNEYRATVSGIEFHIIHALDGSRHSFGLTARRVGDQTSNNLADLGGWGIAWMGTKRKCIAAAEGILARETEGAQS